MMTAITRTPGKLRAVLEEAKRSGGHSLSDMTVLAAQNDPYRVDTPAGHRDAVWFKDQLDRALEAGGRKRERIHLRGLHYSIISTDGGVLKPNNKVYLNADPDWQWLQAFPAKAARWLAYVPFQAIQDQRNEPPVFHYKPAEQPEPYLTVDASVLLPEPEDLTPRVRVTGFTGRQPYHLAIFGEKSSLTDSLLPIAQRYGASLFLPTGEISDSQMYEMARHAIEDGRPLRVFTLADCDPAGWQMPVSISRKLQALKDMIFPALDYQVRRVGLTVDQAKELNLPSSPLKETERRRSKWVEAFGIEQTEIDALATLRPDVLEEIVRQALDPFFDHGLEQRVYRARRDWLEAAQQQLEAQMDSDLLDDLRAKAADKLSQLEEELDAINHALRQSVPEDITFPMIEIPQPVIDPALHGKPLISSAWPWIEQTAALKRQKAYTEEEATA